MSVIFKGETTTGAFCGWRVDFFGTSKVHVTKKLVSILIRTVLWEIFIFQNVEQEIKKLRGW